jgi:Tol biopolymer transport system component/predicted Ser/Thr protein kinase
VRIGAGGMGEVYRARDTRLGRDVAVKMLTSDLTDDAVRKRFRREARAISALNDPHICALYDVGDAEGREYLVMEYLEGETLAQRLARGALPHDEALRYAIEIASALDRAHRKGIVHRDLKPGNIMLTRTGAKLLDFGLARITETDASTPPLTQDDAFVGTFEYMAPEQLNGSAIDARADIFAFGVVLYEMLGGARPFSGHNRASLIGAILFAPPRPLHEHKPETSRQLVRLVEACLAKDPEDRIQTAHDLRLQLEWIRDGASGVVSRGRRLSRRKSVVAAGLAAAVLAGAALGAYFVRQTARPPETRQVRFTLQSPIRGESVEWPALSPGGNRIAFVSVSNAGVRTLWIRDLASTEARQVPGVTLAVQPFWSKDGHALHFFSADKLQSVAPTVMRVETLAAINHPRGASAGADGTILFTPSVTGPIFAIGPAGGKPREVTHLDRAQQDSSHRWPEFLPDGEHFLFVIQSRSLERSGLYVGSIRNRIVKKISTLQSRAVVSGDGSIYFVQRRQLMRQPFDLEALRPTGRAQVVANGIAPDLRITGATSISLANDGTLAYGSPADTRTVPTLVDASGATIRALGPEQHYVNPSLSPDETMLAVSKIDEETGRNSIWLIDMRTGAASAFVDDESNADNPVWAADGRSILYCSDRRGTYEVYERRVGAVAADVLRFPSSAYAQVTRDTPAGTVYHVATRPASFWFEPRGGKPRRVGGITEGVADLSPDGRWLAGMNVRSENTAYNLFVQAIDDASLKIQVTSDGGSQTTWSPEGTRLYFVQADGWLAGIDFDDGHVGARRKFFRMVTDLVFYSSRDFVPLRGGSRFVVLRPRPNRRDAEAVVVVRR